MPRLFTLCVIVVALVGSPALAAKPTGVVVLVDRVEKSTAGKSSRVTIYGTFGIRRPGKAAARGLVIKSGYLHLYCPKGKRRACLRDWKTLAAAIRTERCRVFGQIGARGLAPSDVRPLDSKLPPPKPYPLNVNVRGVRGVNAKLCKKLLDERPPPWLRNEAPDRKAAAAMAAAAEMAREAGLKLPPPPNAERHKMEIRGSLPKAVILGVVARHRADIDTCTQHLPKAKRVGVVVVQWTIGPNGAVLASVVQSARGIDRRTSGCMAKTVRRWKFPKPRGGGIVIVAYPFELQLKPAKGATPSKGSPKGG